MQLDRLLIPESDLNTITTEISDQKHHEFHLVDSKRKIPGHILFSYNTMTGEIKQAEIEYCKDVDFITRLPVRAPRTVMEPNCIYRQALNKKNFIKRLLREGVQVKQNTKRQQQ